ncbi:hypothetical protein GCM10010531_37990 [Blastococcus jejuensis]|uniref:M23ase beta-sheet core domain-containing protein n=1 Tax=Blastococcus jejuensis TaxID=351224 RepID=A0ABP6PJU5_9ACTN
MSSLHQDHLLAEGSEPVTGSRPTLAPARGKTRRIAGSAEEKAPNEVPTPRRGKPRTTTTQTTSTARRATGTDAGPTKPRKTAAKPATATAVTTTSAATAKPATAKAPAKPATAKPATARTAAKPATAKAAAKPATAKAAAKPATAKAATAKPAAKPATAKAPATRSAATKSAAIKAAAAQAAPAKVAAKPRPTPYKRADDAALLVLAAAADAAELTDAAEAQAIEVVTEATPAVVATSPEHTSPEVRSPEALVAAVAQGRRRLFPRRLPTRRRRPALYLAAALAGALGVSLTPADPPAQAQTQTVSHSVSVAEQLGIEAQAQPIEEITPEAASARLEELAISRNERLAEQTAAADAQAAADQAAAEAAAEAARPKAVMPVAGARLTSGYGSRWGTLHAGIDLAAPMMTPEYAVMDGVVLEAGPASGFGNAVYIQHENGDVTVYGHMEQILVSAGQVVKAGDTIALLGNRGQSTGPHLHFEVHVGGIDGTKIDPIPWLRERGVNI